MSDYDYWVSIEKVYKVTSDVPLSNSEAITLVENGTASLKEVNWGLDEELLEDNNLIEVEKN